MHFFGIQFLFICKKYTFKILSYKDAVIRFYKFLHVWFSKNIEKYMSNEFGLVFHLAYIFSMFCENHTLFVILVFWYFLAISQI